MIIIIIAQEIILLYKSIFYVGCLRKKVVCSIELFTPRSEQSASSKKRRTTSSSSFAPDQFSDNIDLEDLIDNLWCSWPLGQYLGYPWGHLATSKNLVTFMLPWEYFSTGWSGSKYDEGIHSSEKVTSLTIYDALDFWVSVPMVSFSDFYMYATVSLLKRGALHINLLIDA